MNAAALSLSALLATALAAPAARAEDAFAIETIPSAHRTVAADLADLDGDGRTDLLQVVFEGIPPRDTRTLRVHFQTGGAGDGEGAIPTGAQLAMPLPPGAAAYDLADALPAPGTELLLLRRDGVLVVSFAGRQTTLRHAQLPVGAVTAGPDADERGLSRLPLTSGAFGPGPMLVVPGLGEAFLLTPGGELRARLRTGERVNYFVQPPGLIYAESDIQFFADLPRLSIGDVDGDGRSDVLGSSRHELRVFLQQPDGGFATEASRRIALGLVSLEDHMRGSGAVRALGTDVDGDGRMDLLLSVTSGGITNARSVTTLHFNRGGGWDLENADFTLEREAAAVADQLLDVDDDGRMELLQGRIPLSVLELVELVLTRSFDTHVAFYRAGPDGDGDGAPEPWYERKLGLPMSLETGRLEGFIPSFEHDLNGDGVRDFLHSADGGAVEVYLGGGDDPYRDRAARQELDTEGVIRAGDLNGDGLVDFVLFNPRRPDAPIRLLTNLRTLPGTSPSMRSAEAGP